MVSIPSQEIPSIETKYGELEASLPSPSEAIFNDIANVQVASTVLRLRMGYQDTIAASLERYMHRLRQYEHLELLGDPGQSLLMLAKEDLAEALLRELQYPVRPVIPDTRPKYIQKQSRAYKKIPIPMEIRWQVWERDNFTCQACGARRLLTVDHIIAEVKGGTLELTNLQTLCGSCNSRKGDR